MAIEATRDAELVLVDSFGERPILWSRPVGRNKANDIVVTLKAGETLIGTSNIPTTVPPKPDNACPVFKVPGRADDG